MGRPVAQESTEGIEETSAQQQPAAAPVSERATLPPEAIDLATKLFQFARDGKTDELSQYLTAGVPPDLTNGTGDTLLMLASYHGHAETVDMLLARGADADAINDRGQSPIAGAVFKGFDDVVRLLFNQGHADIRRGQPTAVQTARMFRRAEILRLFGIEEGVGEGAQPLPGSIPAGPHSHAQV